MAVQYMGNNPFRDCADPGNAIPSAACDRAFAALEQAILAQRNPIVLSGPIGAGKTLLLRRIAERPPPSVRTVFLPWLNVSGEDLVPWIRGFEGTGVGEDFVAAARTLHTRGLRTLLLVDEAQGMTRDSAECLAELAGRAEGAVQVLLAGTDRPSLQAAATAFHGGAEYIELAGQVTPEEVAHWAQLTFGADRPALPKDLDWAELVQKAEGVPRLVRWELERRLATGDLAAALARQAWPDAARPESTPATKSEVVLALPAAPGLPPPALEERSVPSPYRVRASQWRADLSTRLMDRIRRSARRSREVFGNVEDATRRHARLLRGAIARTPRQLSDAIASRTESLGGLVFAREEGFAARRTAALRNARVWSAHYSSALLRRGRSALLSMAEALGEFQARLRPAAIFLWEVAQVLWEVAQEVALAAIRRAAQAAFAIRREVRRAAHPELVQVTSLPSPSRLLSARRSLPFTQTPGLRAGTLAVLALVAAVAFLLGRVTAEPNAGRAPRGFTPVQPPLVASRPAAPQPAPTTGTPPGSAAESAQAPQESNPSARVRPEEQPHSGFALHPAPPAHKHVLIEIEAHPRARIWIDGRDVGRTPLAHVHLATGRHKFLVVFADGRRINRTLEIHQGTHVVKFS
jgi:hypothetical protein